MKYKCSLFVRVIIDGWQIYELVRETNFVKRNMKSNLHDFLPGVKQLSRTFSLCPQFSALLEHDKKFVKADPHSTLSIKNGISGSDHSVIEYLGSKEPPLVYPSV